MIVVVIAECHFHLYMELEVNKTNIQLLQQKVIKINKDKNSNKMHIRKNLQKDTFRSNLKLSYSSLRKDRFTEI